MSNFDTQPPHLLSAATGSIKTIRCSCGDRFRAAWRARSHSDAMNYFWRLETGRDDRPMNELVVPYQ